MHVKNMGKAFVSVYVRAWVWYTVILNDIIKHHSKISLIVMIGDQV